MKKLRGPIIRLHFMRNNSVVIDTTHGLIHFPHMTMQVNYLKWNNRKTPAYHHWWCPYNTTEYNRNYHTLFWPSVRVEHNGDCDTIGEVYENSKFTGSPSNLDKNWQGNSGQGSQYNGVTISNQKEYTDCRVLRNRSGAIQAQKTNRYGNL